MKPSLPQIIRPERNSLIIAASYLVVGNAYILISSWLAKVVSYDTAQLARYEVLKGVAFITTTALLLYLLTRYLFWMVNRCVEEMLEKQGMLPNERAGTRAENLQQMIDRLALTNPTLAQRSEFLALAEEVRALNRELNPARASPPSPVTRVSLDER